MPPPTSPLYLEHWSSFCARRGLRPRRELVRVSSIPFND